MTVKFPALTEVEGKLTDRQAKLKGIFDEAGPEYDMSKVKSLDGDSAAKVAAIRTLNEELDGLGAERDGLLEVQKAARRVAEQERDGKPADDEPAERGGRKSFGELFTDSVAYKGKAGNSGPEAHLNIDLKALFDTNAGPADIVRTSQIVNMAVRPLQVIDLFAQVPTDQTAITYLEENVFTNNAAEIPEAGLYPESALGLTERSSPVRKIGTWIPVTDEQLEDAPFARAYLNERLPFMVRQRLDSQLLVGNGTAPNLRGLINTTGIQTQAKGTDPVPDAIYKAMVKIRVVGQALPDAVAMNPLDWQDVRLLRTADGIYIWGSPAEVGPARLWGLPVVECQGLTENTALVGDFRNFAQLANKRGMDVQITNSHSDFFIYGKQAIRADVRVALVVYRPAAFCTVTGV